jgi:threonine 3-dehydrogenase
METMKAVVKKQPGVGFEFLEMPISGPGQGEVLIKVKAAALCGTDIHIYDWNLWAQNANISLPMVVGHEAAGEVAALGEGITGLKIGDRVAGETHIPCGQCLQCQIGEQHICANLKLWGVHTNGCFAEYAIIPALCARKIPDEISFQVGSILEPLGTAFRAVSESGVPGKQVTVIGCGPIGLFAVGAAAMMGASKVIGIDISDFRLAAAKAMRATHVLNPERDNIVQSILDLTRGFGADAIIEASGNVGAIKQAFKYLRKGGRFAMIGMPGKPIELELVSEVVFKEAKIFGIHGRRMFSTWQSVAGALASGKLDVSPVLTCEMPMSAFKEAIALAKAGQANKVILMP